MPEYGGFKEGWISLQRQPRELELPRLLHLTGSVDAALTGSSLIGTAGDALALHGPPGVRGPGNGPRLDLCRCREPLLGVGALSR